MVKLRPTPSLKAIFDPSGGGSEIKWYCATDIHGVDHNVITTIEDVRELQQINPIAIAALGAQEYTFGEHLERANNDATKANLADRRAFLATGSGRIAALQRYNWWYPVFFGTATVSRPLRPGPAPMLRWELLTNPTCACCCAGSHVLYSLRHYLMNTLYCGSA